MPPAYTAEKPPGEPIRIRTVDDVKVAWVMVHIAGGEDGLVEQGEAERVERLWWIYTAAQAASAEPRPRRSQSPRI